MKRFSKIVLLSSVVVMLSSGCTEEIDCNEVMCDFTHSDYSTTRAPLSAYCQISVSGHGVVEMETDYVPNVTCCENGGAPQRALEAQAVAARSVAYHNMANRGGKGPGTEGHPIGDGEGVQVYSCNGRANSLLPKCKAAADSTSGYILRYKGKNLCAFYVAGNKEACLDDKCHNNASGPGCKANTEHYVTYNEGKSGDNVTQSSQGLVDKTNYANRGTMSQNGARCLDTKRNYNWLQIVKFYYGEDIEPVKVTGSCINSASSLPGTKPPEPVVECKTVIDKSGVIIDDKDGCFMRSTGTSSWYEKSLGHDGHLYFTYTWGKEAEVIGTWKINVTRPGKYEVFAYVNAADVSDMAKMSVKAPYTIRASGTNHTVVKDLTSAAGWISLGSFDFAKGGDQWVRLDDASGEQYVQNDKNAIIFDAVKLEDAVTCKNECTKAGELKCADSGDKLLKCADGNSDGCLEWVNDKACDNGTECKNGACVAPEETCTDDCQMGDVECESDAAWHQCGSYDMDSCLDWSPKTVCAPDEICKDGACVPDEKLDCEHECIENERICGDDNKSFRICGQFDKDSCREYSELKECDAGQVCYMGICVDEKDNSTGSKECVLEIDGRESTIIDDLDPCFERSQIRWSQLETYGYEDHLFYAAINDTGKDNAVGTWHLNVTKSGKYTIKAYIESEIGNVVDDALYTVYASGEKYQFKINIKDASGWVKIGDFDLEEGVDQYVRLSDDSFPEEMKDSDEKSFRRFVFDAIKIEPYSEESSNQDESGREDNGDDNTGDSNVTVKSSESCSAAPLAPSTDGGMLAILAALGMSGLALRRRRS